MTNLFFYGTLRHVPLLEIVLGRGAADIDWHDAQLPGYEVCSVAEGPFPGIRASDGATAKGVLVRGLSAEDIARLDYYEGGFDYSLVTETLADGQVAQVYLPSPGAWTLQGPWTVENWAQEWGAMTCFASES